MLKLHKITVKEMSICRIRKRSNWLAHLICKIFIIILLSSLLTNLSCRKHDDDPEPVYDERNISRNEGRSSGAVLAVDGLDNIHIAWQDEESGEWQVYYRERYSDGEWGEVEDITQSDYPSQVLSIAASSEGKVYLVWEEENNNEIEIHFAEKEEGEWSEPINISGVSGGTNALPDISVDGSGNVYVCWMGDFGGISFRKREGDVWNSRVDISGTFGWENPMMFVEGDGKVHIVTDHGEICYFYSLDGGESWNKEMVVDSAFQDTYYDWGADVVVLNKEVFVVWMRSVYGEGIKGLWMAIKDTNGVWSEPGKIPGPENSPYGPLIDKIVDNLYIVYESVAGSEGDIFYIKRQSTGDWDNPVNISVTGASSGLWKGFDISSSGDLEVVWREKLGNENWDIYFDEIVP